MVLAAFLAVAGIAGVGILLVWANRTRIAQGVAKKLFGIDVEMKHLKLRVKRNPLRIVVEAEDLTLYTPPGHANEDVALKLPQATATLTKLDAKTAKETGHAWSMEADLNDMQVQYVFVELDETNFDRIIKAVLVEKIQEVPEEQRTEDMKEIVEKHGAKVPPPPKAKEAGVEVEKKEEQGAMVVTRVSLNGRSRVLVRAGKVPLLPPISLGAIEVDPELLKSPVGLLLFINSLVLKTLSSGGYDLVHLVASNAMLAGLAVTGTSVVALKSLVTGGRLAVGCTSRHVASAASGTVHAGKAVVTGTWDGVHDMARYTGVALVGAGGAVGGATGAVIGGVGDAGRFVGNTTGAAVGATGVALGATGSALFDGSSKAAHGVAEAGKFVGNTTGAALGATGSALYDGSSKAAKGVTDAGKFVGNTTGAALGATGNFVSEGSSKAVHGVAEAGKFVGGAGAAVAGAGGKIVSGLFGGFGRRRNADHQASPAPAPASG